jgi:hypothetical protein
VPTCSWVTVLHAAHLPNVWQADNAGFEAHADDRRPVAPVPAQGEGGWSEAKDKLWAGSGSTESTAAGTIQHCMSAGHCMEG